jgi:hypothetical protein
MYLQSVASYLREQRGQTIVTSWREALQIQKGSLIARCLREIALCSVCVLLLLSPGQLANLGKARDMRLT